MLVGAAVPEQFALCSGRRSCSALHRLAVVCDDDVLEVRLRARPTWRRSGTAEVIATMLDVNRWLRMQIATTPPMLLLDTSHLSSGQTIAQSQTWTWIHLHRPPQSGLRERTPR